MNKETINVSEIFHSVQGEGNTMGKPSVFLRLQACNLMCGGMGTQKDKELHNGATWRCDTIETWLEGEGWPVKALTYHLFSEYSDKFLNGSQLVITGGEPTLQQSEFTILVQALQTMLAKEIRVEVETNGTIFPELKTCGFVNQFNVSPKLRNSGMLEERRIKPDALREYVDLSNADNAIFKFVVTREEDLNEILADYSQPFEIPKEKVWLMPGCSNREQFEEVSPLVAKACQKHGFQFSSRLQINLWNEVTGV